MHDILDRTVGLVELPEEHALVADEAWRKVYEQLFGGAAALVEAGTTIGLRIEGIASYPDLVPRLGSILRAMLDESQCVRWTDRDFALWSSGFFMNRAQANLVASVDRALNLILTKGITSIEAESDLHALWWTVRAKVARHLFPTLADELGALIEGQDGLNALKDRAMRGENLSLWTWLAAGCLTLERPEDIYARVSSQVDQATAFFAVVEQVNWFKHHPSGAAQERRPSSGLEPRLAGRVSVVQWSASVRAFEFAAGFARRAAEVVA